MTTKLTPTSIVMQERGPARQLIMTVLRAKCHLQLLEYIFTTKIRRSRVPILKWERSIFFSIFQIQIAAQEVKEKRGMGVVQTSTLSSGFSLRPNMFHGYDSYEEQQDNKVVVFLRLLVEERAAGKSQKTNLGLHERLCYSVPC